MKDHAFCTSCGSEIPPGAQFCGSCGHPVVAAAPNDAPSTTPAPGPASAEPAPVESEQHESTVSPAASVPVAPTGEPHRANRQRKVLALLVVIAMVAAGGGIVWARHKSGNAHAGEILLEPAATTGVDPFTADVSTAEPAAATSNPSTAAVSSSTNASTTTTPAVQTIRGIDTTRVGLYGGTLNQSSCDPERLITFLQGDPAKAQAWAAVEGIRVSDIPTYVRGLTPVVLRIDTRVTNHGYRDGHATAHQSVLQAGTAVLVDRYGVPRARCACGNPLLPAEPVLSTPFFSGDAWPGFQVTTVVNVVNVSHTVINNFVLVDLNTLGLIRRIRGAGHGDATVSIRHYCELFPATCRPSGLAPPPRLTTPVTRPGEAATRTGVVQVSLRWSSTADLDLSVIDPHGNPVDYSHRHAADGGQLDVDANAACRAPTSTPVENVIWPSSAPDGTYTVTVTYYTNCGNPSPQGFDLTALVNGQEVALAPATTGALARPGSVAIVPALATDSHRELLVAAHSQATSLGGQVRFSFRKNPVPPARRRPGPPTRARAVAVGHGATITWLAPTESGPGLKSYVIHVGGATFQTAPGQTKLTLPQQLQPGRTYPVQIWAVNANGPGPPATTQLTAGHAAAPPGGGRGTGESWDDYCARLEATNATDFQPICGLMAPSVPSAGG